MPPCIAMGEAAGVATCQSLEKDITPREIDIKELQVELIKTGGRSSGNIGGFNFSRFKIYQSR